MHFARYYTDIDIGLNPPPHLWGMIPTPLMGLESILNHKPTEYSHKEAPTIVGASMERVLNLLRWHLGENVIIFFNVSLIINVCRLARYWEPAAGLRKLLVNRTALCLNAAIFD